jgi:RNA polymerase sigma-70 factor (TIGR02960 family)
VIEPTLARARAGDEEAFRQLTDPYRHELHVHCYRILGSVQDAEDALQETMLAAWRGLCQFEGRAPLRAWLYRIATNRCLNARRAGRRRPQAWTPAGPGAELPEPARVADVAWIEPYPGFRLEDLADSSAGPAARYEASEAISLAFVTALQLLPPRQRAVLVLRDALGFPATDVAGILGSTQDSVNSALKRARAALRNYRRAAAQQEPPPRPGSAGERELADRFRRAYEDGDVAAVVALLTHDVRLTMPPEQVEYEGRELAARMFGTLGFRDDARSRLAPTRANGQAAFGCYSGARGAQVAQFSGLLVLTVAGTRISAITRFPNYAVGPGFGLPPTLRLGRPSAGTAESRNE